MNGTELAAEIKTFQPGTRVIVLTGFGAGNAVEKRNVDLVLKKPISLTDLRAALVDVMTRPVHGVSGAMAPQVEKVSLTS